MNTSTTRARALVARAQLLTRMSVELTGELEALVAELGTEEAQASTADEVAPAPPAPSEQLQGSADEIVRLRAAIVAYHQGATIAAGNVMLEIASAHSTKHLSALTSGIVRALTERYTHALAVWELCEEVHERSGHRYIAALLARHSVRHVWDLSVDLWRTCACTLADWDHQTRARHIHGRIARVVDAQGVQP